MSELKRAEPPCAVSRAEHFLSLHWQWQLTPRFSIGEIPNRSLLANEIEQRLGVGFPKERQAKERRLVSIVYAASGDAIGEVVYYYVVYVFINYIVASSIKNCAPKDIAVLSTTQPKTTEIRA